MRHRRDVARQPRAIHSSHPIAVAVGRGIRGFPQPILEVERRILAVADSQRGLITTRQLLAIGLSQDAVDRRVAAGRLTPVHRGVYAVGRLALGPLARWKAATLAVGEDALLGYLFGAGLWEVWPEPQGDPHVVLAGGGWHPQRGIVVHRMRRMEPSDRSEVKGIPVTSLELTCLHLATMLSRRSLERTILRAARRPEFSIDEAVALGRRSRGRPGVRAYRAIIERDLRAEMRSLSELESRFVAALRHHDIRLPEINHDVEALKVDAVWHDANAIVELDGFAFHRLPRDLRNDNARTRKLVLRGYRVIRFVWDDVVRDPAGVAATIIELLGGATAPSRW